MGAKPGLSQVREEYAEGVREQGVEEGILALEGGSNW